MQDRVQIIETWNIATRYCQILWYFVLFCHGVSNVYVLTSRMRRPPNSAAEGLCGAGKFHEPWGNDAVTRDMDGMGFSSQSFFVGDGMTLWSLAVLLSEKNIHINVRILMSRLHICQFMSGHEIDFACCVDSCDLLDGWYLFRTPGCVPMQCKGSGRRTKMSRNSPWRTAANVYWAWTSLTFSGQCMEWHLVTSMISFQLTIHTCLCKKWQQW